LEISCQQNESIRKEVPFSDTIIRVATNHLKAGVRDEDNPPTNFNQPRIQNNSMIRRVGPSADLHSNRKGFHLVYGMSEKYIITSM